MRVGNSSTNAEAAGPCTIWANTTSSSSKPIKANGRAPKRSPTPFKRIVSALPAAG